MGNQVMNVAVAQAVGQSAAVTCDTTPFMEGHSALCIIESSSDRVVKLQKSDDGGTTWVDVTGVTTSGGAAFFEVVMSDKHRIDVSGGTGGTGTCKFVA